MPELDAIAAAICPANVDRRTGGNFVYAGIDNSVVFLDLLQKSGCQRGIHNGYIEREPSGYCAWGAFGSFS